MKTFSINKREIIVRSCKSFSGNHYIAKINKTYLQQLVAVSNTSSELQRQFIQKVLRKKSDGNGFIRFVGNEIEKARRIGLGWLVNDLVPMDYVPKPDQSKPEVLDDFYARVEFRYADGDPDDWRVAEFTNRSKYRDFINSNMIIVK